MGQIIPGEIGLGVFGTQQYGIIDLKKKNSRGLDPTDRKGKSEKFSCRKILQDTDMKKVCKKENSMSFLYGGYFRKSLKS